MLFWKQNLGHKQHAFSGLSGIKLKEDVEEIISLEEQISLSFKLKEKFKCVYRKVGK